MEIEKRILTTNASLRAESQGDVGVLTGYAARFNVLSHPLPGGFREQIAPGAFSRSIAAGDDCICTFNHDVDKVLGRVKSGTLHVYEDPKGLKFRCLLDPNQQAHLDLHASVKRGDISDCSFAFAVQPGGEDFDGTGDGLVRTLRNVKLMDVSVVTHPAYPQTSVDARAAAAVVTRESKALRHERAQSIAASMPELSMEDISRGMRLGYSEDAFLQLRSVAIGKQIRDGGQVSDPTQSLRDAVKYHRACASTAKSMAECERHHNLADSAEKKLKG